jgi:hypothetical protein
VDILFPTIVILKNSRIKFDLTETTHLNVLFRDAFMAPSSTYIDFTAVSTKLRFKSVA